MRRRPDYRDTWNTRERAVKYSELTGIYPTNLGDASCFLVCLPEAYERIEPFVKDSVETFKAKFSGRALVGINVIDVVDAFIKNRHRRPS